MIVKSVPHKHNNFARLINYIHDDHGRQNSVFTFDLCHNLRSIDRNEIINEFKQNTQLKKVRKNGTSLYHDILSFSPKDRKHLTLDKLYDLSLKYIELRGTAGICFAKPHVHQDHLHVHFCFSGNQYQSEKSLRLTRKQFYQVREELEKYQIKEYPELSHSLVYIDKPKVLKTNGRVATFNPTIALTVDKEVQKVSNYFKHPTKPTPTIRTDALNKHEKKLISHDEIISVVQRDFDQSKGLNDFIEKLKSRGLQPFARNGRPSGVLLKNKRYSFSELRISKEHLRILEKFDKLKRLILNRTPNRESR